MTKALPDLARPEAVETLQVPRDTGGEGIYRLVGSGVVAKHLPDSRSTAELLFYQEVARHIGRAVPALVAVHREENGVWLLLEDVDGVRPDVDSSRDTRLVSAAIASVHQATIPMRARELLPQRGLGEAIINSCTARRLLSQVRPELTEPEASIVSSLEYLLGAFEGSQAVFENALADESSVLVHCDASAKNILRTKEGRIVLLDWEYAGIGPSAIDYHAWDLDAYAAAARIDRTLLEVRSQVGYILATIRSIEWSARKATWPWRNRAMHQLEFYRNRLGESLDLVAGFAS